MANRIKQIREVLKYTQQEFGKQLDISQSIVMRYEKDVVEIHPNLLKKIARNFNINMNWLILGEGEMFMNNDTINSSKTTSNITDTRNSIIDELNDIDNEDLLDYINDEIKIFKKRVEISKRYGNAIKLA